MMVAPYENEATAEQGLCRVHQRRLSPGTLESPNPLSTRREKPLIQIRLEMPRKKKIIFFQHLPKKDGWL